MIVTTIITDTQAIMIVVLFLRCVKIDFLVSGSYSLPPFSGMFLYLPVASHSKVA